MTISQSNRERMGSTTLDTLNSNDSVWSGTPTVVNHVTQFHKNLDNVRSWRDKQAEALEIPGLTRDKNVLRSFIAIEAVIIIAAIKALATDTNNNALAKSVNISESDLLKSKEGDFIALATQVKNVAQANTAALIPYSVTDAMINQLADDITSFQNIYTKTQSAKDKIAVYTKNLADAVKTMMTQLKNALDNSIQQYRKSSSDFFNAYKRSRKIVNYGNTQTGMRGSVTNIDTNQKLKNIIVEIVELGLITTTDQRGVYSFGRVSFGKYTIRVRGIGYTTSEFPDVQLSQGRLMDFDIQLHPQPAPVPVNA